MIHCIPFCKAVYIVHNNVIDCKVVILSQIKTHRKLKLIIKMYLNPNAINSIKLAVSSVLSVQKRGIVYLPIYKGPFDYKRTHTKAYKFPFNINKSELEEEFNEINQIRKLDIKEVSPFHLVWRYKSMRNIPW